MSVLGLISSTGCLDVIEPTPVSSSVEIVAAKTSGFELTATNFISASFQITNTGTRALYVDTKYRRLEKLVNQRWELVDEQSPTSLAFSSSLPPNRRIVASYSLVHDRNGRSGSPLLEHVRGLYRLRFRIALIATGTELLPEEESYSQPFAVDCC
ncbi:MAG TPA: hypothetical protein VF042_01070 [Gemmatimonadaceae bacterium]